MKIVSIFLTVVVLLTMFGGIIGCGGGNGIDLSNPEDVVRGCLDALESGDIDEVKHYWTSKGFEEEGISTVFEMESVAVSYEISNLKVEVLSQDGDRAEILTEYDLKVITELDTETPHIDNEVYHLEKRSDGWLITSWEYRQTEDPEFSNVRLAVLAFMADHSIADLSTDSRITSYAGDLDSATNDMTELIRMDSNSTADYLVDTTTSAKYWVEPDGTVHQVVDNE